MKLYSIFLAIFILSISSNSFAIEISLAAGEGVSVNDLTDANIDYVSCSQREMPTCHYERIENGYRLGIQRPEASNIEWISYGNQDPLFKKENTPMSIGDVMLKLKELREAGFCN